MESFRARDGQSLFLGRAFTDDGNRFKVALDANGKCYLIIYDENANEIISLNEAQGIRLLGNATTWEDLNFDVLSSGLPASAIPQLITIGNVYYRSFATNDEVFGQREVPHCAKTSSTAQWHFHAFIEPGQSVGTTGAEFTLYWEHRNNGTTTNGTATGTITSAQLTTSSSGGKIDVNMSSPISIDWGGQMTARFLRTGGNAGRVVATTYGLHHEVDGNGSDTITTKT